MSDGESTIIPLDDAQTILSMFGIGPYSRAYQRWRRDDGFRLVDFEEVLAESDRILGVDWRDVLQDAADLIVQQLASLGFTVSADLGDEGVQGTIDVDGQSAGVKYVPSDDDKFDRVIAAVNRLIDGRARYRKFRSCEGTDSWCYALLSNADWCALRVEAPAMLDLLFADVSS
jgi:hypothetical protein